MNLSVYIHHITIQLLKHDPRCMCVIRATQVWNILANNYQVLNLFTEPTKSETESASLFHVTLITFHDFSTLFSVSQKNIDKFFRTRSSDA